MTSPSRCGGSERSEVEQRAGERDRRGAGRAPGDLEGVASGPGQPHRLALTDGRGLQDQRILAVGGHLEGAVGPGQGLGAPTLRRVRGPGRRRNTGRVEQVGQQLVEQRAAPGRTEQAARRVGQHHHGRLLLREAAEVGAVAAGEPGPAEGPVLGSSPDGPAEPPCVGDRRSGHRGERLLHPLDESRLEAAVAEPEMELGEVEQLVGARPPPRPGGRGGVRVDRGDADHLAAR